MKKPFFTLMIICSFLNKSIIIFASSGTMSWPGDNSERKIIKIDIDTQKIPSSPPVVSDTPMTSSTKTTSSLDSPMPGTKTGGYSNFLGFRQGVASIDSFQQKNKYHQPQYNYESNGYKANNQDIKDWEERKKVAAIKSAQEDNLDNFSYRLEIRNGECLSLFRIEELVPGAIVPKERLEEQIAVKKNLYNEIETDINRYESFPEHVMELKNKAVSVEQEIGSLQSQVRAVDLVAEKIRAQKAIEKMTCIVNHLREEQAKRLTAQEIFEKIKSDKIAACEQAQSDIITCAVDDEHQILLRNVLIGLDCREDTKFDEGKWKKHLMLSKSTDSSDDIPTMRISDDAYYHAISSEEDTKSFHFDVDQNKKNRRAPIFKSAETIKNEIIAAKEKASKDLAQQVRNANQAINSGKYKPQDKKYKKAKAVIKHAELIRLNDSFENLLPHSFKVKITKKGIPERNSKGAFIDIKNNAWSYDSIKKQWKVENKKDRYFVNAFVGDELKVSHDGGKVSVYVKDKNGLYHLNQAKTDELFEKKQKTIEENALKKSDLDKSAKQTQIAVEEKNKSLTSVIKTQDDQKKNQTHQELSATAKNIMVRDGIAGIYKQDDDGKLYIDETLTNRYNATQVPKTSRSVIASHIKNQSGFPSESTESIEEISLDNEKIRDSTHFHCMPEKIAAELFDQFITMKNPENGDISEEEINMVQGMLNAMVYAKNNMTVEFAQTGLQAWNDAQQADSDKKYNVHMQKCIKHYDLINNKFAIHSMEEQAKSVDKIELDRMLQNYNNVLADSRDQKLLNPQQAVNPHALRLEKRARALTQSQEQLDTNKLISRDFKMSSDARGYLMANNMNYAAFDSIVATNIQHCLTQENIDIIELATELAQRYGYNEEAKEFIKYRCDLAITAQQLNQRSRIEEAAVLTDFNHVNSFLEQSILEDQAELKGFIAMGKGAGRALYKWSEFLVKLGCEPIETTREMAKNLYEVGNALSSVASIAYDFSPAASALDYIRDDIGFSPNQSSYADGAISPTTFTDQRALKNEQTLEHITKTTDAIIEFIKNRPPEDTLTDISEMLFDAYLTTKAIQAVGNLASKVGSKITTAAHDLHELLPVELMDEVVVFVETTAGEVVAVSEKSGTNIEKAAQAQALVNKAERIERTAIKAKKIASDVAKLTSPDSAKVKAFEKSIESFCNSEKVLNVKELKSLKGIDQIERYRTYTNNFSPEGLAKLKPEEILHLNLCNWLEPKARIINARIKDIGGLKVRHIRNGIECVSEIYEFDLFHSLLGEVNPGFTNCHTKGGHLFIPELKAALLDIGEIKPLKNGFFDLGIKYKGKASLNFKDNSYFPAGTSVEQAVGMIEKAIANIEKIENVTGKGRIDKVIYQIELYNNQAFRLCIKNKTATFFPFFE